MCVSPPDDVLSFPALCHSERTRVASALLLMRALVPSLGCFPRQVVPHRDILMHYPKSKAELLGGTIGEEPTGLAVSAGTLLELSWLLLPQRLPLLLFLKLMQSLEF